MTCKDDISSCLVVWLIEVRVTSVHQTITPEMRSVLRPRNLMEYIYRLHSFIFDTVEMWL